MRRRDFVTATGVTVTKPGRFLQRTLANMGTTARKRRYNREVASSSLSIRGRRTLQHEQEEVVRDGDCLSGGG